MSGTNGYAPGMSGGQDAGLERLRKLSSVVEAASDVDADHLLDQLVERVREIFYADSAVVFLLEEDGSHLVARAAAGVEEELRQGARVPLGKGFAGRVAELKRPLILDGPDQAPAATPPLIDGSVQTMLGAP